MQIQAFHNSETKKNDLISQLQTHYDNGEIRQGTYWEAGKGCAIGCTVHSDVHHDYEKLGLPEWFAHLEDAIYSGMLYNESANQFPIRLKKAIPVGFNNWKSLYHSLCVYLLEDICTDTDYPLVKGSISKIISLHKQQETNPSVWLAAQLNAEIAVRTTESIASSIYLDAIALRGEAKSVWSTTSEKLEANSLADQLVESTWTLWASARSVRCAAKSAAKIATWSQTKPVPKSSAHAVAHSLTRLIVRSAAESVTWTKKAIGTEDNFRIMSVAFTSIGDKLIELLESH